MTQHAPIAVVAADDDWPVRVDPDVLPRGSEARVEVDAPTLQIPVNIQVTREGDGHLLGSAPLTLEDMPKVGLPSEPGIYAAIGVDTDVPGLRVVHGDRPNTFRIVYDDQPGGDDGGGGHDHEGPSTTEALAEILTAVAEATSIRRESF